MKELSDLKEISINLYSKQQSKIFDDVKKEGEEGNWLLPFMELKRFVDTKLCCIACERKRSEEIMKELDAVLKIIWWFDRNS